MSKSHLTHHFVGQDLRNQSFRRQCLNGANFRGADLRGCNFSKAQLIGANFEQARMGQTRRQLGIWVGIAIATLLIAGHAISTLVAGSLGQTPTDKAWSYVIALTVSLGIAGGLASARSRLPRLWRRWSDWGSGTIAGAVVGFFYAGTLTNKEPRWAIAGAVVGAVLAATWGWRQSVSSAIALRLTTTLATYGFSCLIGATAIALLNVGRWFPGVVLGVMTLLYLWFTWRGWVEVGKTIHHGQGTSFRGANLTHAQFSQPVICADLTDAIGELSQIKTNFGDGV